MIKSTLIEVASTREMGTRLTKGAAARSSFFRRGTTGVDVLTSGAFSTAGEAGNEDNDEDLLLDNFTTTAAFGE